MTSLPAATTQAMGLEDTQSHVGDRQASYALHVSEASALTHKTCSSQAWLSHTVLC